MTSLAISMETSQHVRDVENREGTEPLEKCYDAATLITWCKHHNAAPQSEIFNNKCLNRSSGATNSDNNKICEMRSEHNQNKIEGELLLNNTSDIQQHRTVFDKYEEMCPVKWLIYNKCNSKSCIPLTRPPSKFIFYSSVVLLILQVISGCGASPKGIDWSQWWTYDGISGPRFWGVINPAWIMCKDGRRQSPINIDPRTLLYDPNLSPFSVEKVAVEGELVNTGHSVEWHIRPPLAGHMGSLSSSMHASSSSSLSSKSQVSSISDTDHSSSSRLLLDSSSIESDVSSRYSNYSSSSGGGRGRGRGGYSSGGGGKSKKGESPSANISGGPLSYTYTLTHARLHFGEQDQQGSEHLLDNHAFPAELQIYGYNSQLYRNFSQAVGQVYGIAAIAVLVQLGDKMGPEFRVMMDSIKSIKYGGSSVRTPPLVISSLLPPTQYYMTYEGSITEPACHETVTWILPNKPIYITLSMMRELRMLRQGNSEPLTHAPIANNFRPVQTAHHRTVRANINTKADESKEERCHISDPRLVYKAGAWLGS